MWDMKKFNILLNRLNKLAKKHFKIFGIETIFFDDGDFQLHAYYNEFPIEYDHEKRLDESGLMNIIKSRHEIQYHKEKDLFAKQIYYDGFQAVQGAEILEEDELDE